MTANHPARKITFLALLFGGLLMALPFWVMVSTSLTDPREVLEATRPIWLPKTLRWENYLTLFESMPMGRYFLNSLFVAGTTTIFHVFFCAMAAYAFSRLRFPGRNALFLVFLVTLMIPPQINIVPLFFLMKTFHWVDTYQALIVPGLFGAFGVFLLRQWMNGLPRELEDAAALDGCNPWQTFWNIILPLSRPALAALAIFVFIGSWNGFLWPLIVTHSDHLRTLPVGMAALKESFRDTVNWPLLMAAATVSILPVIGIFFLGQRQLMQGILAGGLKE